MDIPGLATESSFSLTLKAGSNDDISDIARDNRRTLIRAYEAQLAGDLDSWWSIFDPDVEFHEAESLPYGCSLKGLAAAQRGMAGMFAAWTHVDVEFEQFTAAGDLVIAYLRMRATSRKSGKVYDAPTAELFRFRNGKVIEWRPIYWDTHLVRDVCA